MKRSVKGMKLRLQCIGLCISMILHPFISVAYAVDHIEFNNEVLDLNDRKNIDLSQFARSDYIMPGVYDMVVRINKNELPEQPIAFYVPDNDTSGSRACISRTLADKLGFKEEVFSKLTWWHQGECLDEQNVHGMEVYGELSTSSLYLNVPQAFMEYTSENWDPPSRWDDGIPGLLLDYNLSARTQHQQQDGRNTSNISGNGTAGINLGAWRLRADWQANVDHQTGRYSSTTKNLEWSRYYLFRAIPSLRAKLTLGEDYLNSGVFDSFRFAGLSLQSDNSMLPPNLRGYAPEVVGIAKTNARVTVSQQGRVLYETSVAAGPYRIQDINDAVSGELNVRVEEQDGTVREFTVNTSSIPYLTRPGSVRYKLAAGRPVDIRHHSQGPIFASGEYSWGVSNGWSLYGGALAGDNYSALSLGIGKDLMAFGALSFDVTQSRARLTEKRDASRDGGTLNGGSYRLSYSKIFDEYDSQITFAGYRFSEKNFMSMNDYLDARQYGTHTGNGKEMYTITFNKQFRDSGLTAYANFSHEAYWDRRANDRYNLTLSRYFDLGRWHNLNMSLTAYRNLYNGIKDDGVYASLSVPWGHNSTVSYNAAVNQNDSTQNVSYYGQSDERSYYQLSAGTTRSGPTASGYYSREGDMAQMSVNASYQAGRYQALGMSAEGGLTLTAKGGALHRTSTSGGTRLLVDTEGVADIPVRGYGRNIRTNRWGKTVISDMNSYYRNTASIDLDHLGEQAEATNSVVQATLTEGAIGYRKFNVIAGSRAMAVIRMVDGSAPPFGATVHNGRHQETGIVIDDGSVYLSGINPGESMTVHWNGMAHCEIRMPTPLPKELLMNTLLLPCRDLPAKAEADSKSN